MSSPSEEPLPEEEVEQEKFTKEMEAKFMQDLENIEIGDSDSELESSRDFFETIKKKLTSQITTTKQQQSTTTNNIIEELKATLTKEISNAEQFEEEIKEMKYLNTEAKSVIEEEKILQIKSKLFNEMGNNMSKIVLSEEIVELRESQLKEAAMNEAVFEEVELEEEEEQLQEQETAKEEQEQGNSTNRTTKRPLNMMKKQEKATTLLSSTSNNSSSKLKLQSQFTKKKSTLVSSSLSKNNNHKTIDDKIQKKLIEINLERERINMEREDDRSMRYEKEYMSMFFKERFIQFKMPKTSTIRMPEPNIMIKITKPKNTFTNLEPLPNNEKNVLPKNAPEIALKALKKTKRVSLKPASQTMVKIEFKKVTSVEEISDKNVEKYGLKSNGTMQIQLQKHNQENESVSKEKITNEQSQKFLTILEPYIKQISIPLIELQKISEIYKPKFIKNYLNENEKISNIAFLEEEEDGNGGNGKNKNKERSIEQILSYQEENMNGMINSYGNNNSKGKEDNMISKLKEFKLTFENVTLIKGIERFTSVEYIALQFNQIKAIKELEQLNHIIELNLSNNAIKETKPIERLRELRYLNLGNNKIREFEFLGGSLEILDLKRNNIEIVGELNCNKYLRIIDLTENKLHELGKGFEKLYYLQELLLEKNYIESLEGIEGLLMLQLLDVAHNRLKEIHHNLVYLFLNTLNLSYNQLESIPNMYLPSLEKLYITNNKLTTDNNIKLKLYYLPELKELNLDDNQINGFSTIWAFISYSRKLEIIKYDSNEYFLSVREKVRELYEAIIYKFMHNLKIINHNPYDTGIKAYYESVYGSYLEKSEQLSEVVGGLRNVEQFVSCLLEENKVIANLENRFNKIYNERFVEEEVFIKAKSISRANTLYKVVEKLAEGLMMDENNLQKSNTIKTNKEELVTIKSSPISIINLIQTNNQIYYYHDQFQSNLLKQIHKIKCLFIKFKYKNEKKIKYFQKQKETLLKLFEPIEEFILTNKLKYVIKAFSLSISANKQHEAALMIQKHWRGYKSRKLFTKLLKKLKQKNLEDDDFDLEEVDLDEFEAHEFPEFNFDLPEDINFDNYIIEPKYFELAQEKETKRRQLSKNSINREDSDNKNNNNLKKIDEEKEEEYNPMMNNFIKEEKTKEQKQNKKEEDEKLMKEWGFTNPATLEALRWKKKRKEEMKKKEAEQNMTAAQRYERFKMMHK